MRRFGAAVTDGVKFQIRVCVILAGATNYWGTPGLETLSRASLTASGASRKTTLTKFGSLIPGLLTNRYVYKKASEILADKSGWTYFEFEPSYGSST